jgi:hypothetical protein
MTTLEQILSAFDIADTDGDGFLTWAEAVEAVEALWIDPMTIYSTATTATATSTAGVLGYLEEGEEDRVEEIQEADLTNSLINLDFLWYDSSSLSISSKDKLALSFSLDEFRLVCSQMIAPPSSSSSSALSSSSLSSSSSSALLERPTLCLQRSLEVLLSSALCSWNTHLLQHLRHSFHQDLMELFPIETFLSLSSSSSLSLSSSSASSASSSLGRGENHLSTFLIEPTFRSQWKVRYAVLESELPLGDRKDNESMETEGDAIEKISLPTLPSFAISRLLKEYGTHLHHTALSMDTTHPLTFPISITLPTHTSTSSILCSSLWDYINHLSSSSCRLMVDEELTHRHTVISSWLDHLPSSSSSTTSRAVQELFEEYSLQLLFDLQLLSSSLCPSHTLSTDTDTAIATTSVSSSSSLQSKNLLPPSTLFQSYDLLYNTIDPVNVSFLLPFLEEECELYLRQHHLLLPGVEARHELDQVTATGNIKMGQRGTSGETSGGGRQDSQVEELMRTIFAFSSTATGTSGLTSSSINPSPSGIATAAKKGNSSHQHSASMNRSVPLPSHLFLSFFISVGFLSFLYPLPSTQLGKILNSNQRQLYFPLTLRTNLKRHSKGRWEKVRV